MSNKKMYRQDPLISCFVPTCENTALMMPEKYFFFVPQGNRVEWCAAVDKPNVPKGSVYICEDHINPEEDLANYENWKNGLARARLKPRVPLLKNIYKTCIASSQREDLYLGASSSSFVQPQALTQNKGILCVPDHRNKSSQVKTLTVDKCVSTNMAPSVKVPSEDEPSEDNVSVMIDQSLTSSDFVENESSSETEVTPEKEVGRAFILSLIENDPVSYIGVPKSFWWIIEYLEKGCKLPSLHIIIVLYKIKNNDSFSRISDLFQVSETTIWRFFYKTLNILKCFFQQFVYWPSAIDIKRNLPLPFRVNSEYAKAQCIIDCFEIEIEKRKDPIHQSLSWSQYKNCNTIKYLIGATPDGFINFISEGYGGRSSDINIVKQSGFLDKIPANCTILADRGFKCLETQLVSKSSKLLRPPSVSKDKKMTKEEVIQSKVIASLRVHIERVIRRLRLYKLLKPHSVVNNKLICILDDIVIVACGLINLQSPLLKNV